MAKGNTFRFAVGEPEGERSAVWRLWIQGNDIYLSARSIASDFKASLHASGRWRVAYAEGSPAVPKGEDRARVKFGRPPELFSGWTRAFIVVIPASEVRLAARPPTSADIYWAPKPGASEGVEFDIFISAPGESGDPLPGSRSMGTTSPFDYPLASGERIWVIERETEIGPEFKHLLEGMRREAIDALDRSVEGWSANDPRLIATCEHGDDGTHFFVDLHLRNPE